MRLLSLDFNCSGIVDNCIPRSMRPSNDPLDPLLERWRGAVPPPPGSLAPEVWRRIAVAERPAPVGALARIEVAFTRPAFVVAFVAACVLLGLFTAQLRVSRLQAERNTQLARSYLHLIDPLLGIAADHRITDAPPRS